MATCMCSGPQNGEPLCPCRMRAAREHETVKRHNGEWRKISLDPVPEGQPMRRVELDENLEPKMRWNKREENRMRSALAAQGFTYLQIEEAVQTAKETVYEPTRAPRSIYDEPWMRRILDGTGPL
jgi:hypothetical protein